MYDDRTRAEVIDLLRKIDATDEEIEAVLAQHKPRRPRRIRMATLDSHTRAMIAGQGDIVVMVFPETLH
jgi:hypothetical protein